jgi:hypothetical protein
VTAASGDRRTRHSLVGHATAALTAVALLPPWHHVLRIGGDQYGGAWALIVAAWVLHWRTGWWISWALLWAAILGAVTDLPVVHDTVTYLTGAVW